jgi:hypothetical protein
VTEMLSLRYVSRSETQNKIMWTEKIVNIWAEYFPLNSYLPLPFSHIILARPQFTCVFRLYFCDGMKFMLKTSLFQS